MSKKRQSKKNFKKSIWSERTGDLGDVNFKTDVGEEVLEAAEQKEEDFYPEVLVTEYGYYNPMTREFEPWM